jgi:FKBP-type peptidyl-prolyl cis-trans isomerase
MKLKQISFLVIGLMSSGALAQDAKPSVSPPAAPPAGAAPAGPALMPPSLAKPAEPPDKNDLSYAYGVYFAGLTSNSLARSGFDPKVDLEISKFVEGYSNAIAGATMSMTFQQVTNLLNQETTYRREKVQEDIKKMLATGDENKAKGMKFMEENATAAGVTQLTNGLEYKVLKEGNGEKPATNDLATVSFTAKLIDGTEVLKVEHREIAVMAQGLPPGLGEALTMMKSGSKWTVFLPYQLAFNDQPALGSPMQAPKVGPYSALIFDVELESSRPKPPPPVRSAPPAVTPQVGVQNPGTPSVSLSPTRPGPQTSSDIVRVPSAEELKRGSNVEVMSLEEAMRRSQTNPPASQTNAPGAK